MEGKVRLTHVRIIIVAESADLLVVGQWGTMATVAVDTGEQGEEHTKD